MVSKASVLKAEMRKGIGSKHSRKLRERGGVPAIVYGHKQEPEAIVVDEHNFIEALHHGHRVFDVNLSGKKEKLLVKDVQFDYLGKKIIHADFIRVDLSEKVKVEVAIKLKGTPAGALEGGLLEEHLGEIEIECTVTEIPESIDVSVKNLKVGESLHARDIVLPEGVKLITDPEALLVACHLPAAAPAAEATEESEEPAAPEVITERKPKDDESAEE